MPTNVSIQLPNGQTTSVVREDAKIATSVQQTSKSVTVSSSFVQGNGLSDKHYTYTINVGTWIADAGEYYIEITHNLNKKPSVTVIDSFERVLILDVEYLDFNRVVIRTRAKFSGKVYFN
jgi:hypothetical protein